jgi:biopolymer transport protein ExbD
MSLSKFKKKINTKQEIPTSSMPDVVFMLLFFFMVTTKMRDTSVKVEQRMPPATQLKKLEKKSLIAYLYIGKPKESNLGNEAKIQVNDVFIEPKGIAHWVNESKGKLQEYERDAMTVSMKVDTEAKRGIIADVETELRKANARKILYSSVGKKAED